MLNSAYLSGCREYGGRLCQLDEERTLSSQDAVAGSHAREDAVYRGHGAGGGGHPAAHLRQHGDQAGLTQQSGFAAHVGPAQQEHAGVVLSQGLCDHPAQL